MDDNPILIIVNPLSCGDLKRICWICHRWETIFVACNCGSYANTYICPRCESSPKPPLKTPPQ
jgi:hypothetical protein